MMPWRETLRCIVPLLGVALMAVFAALYVGAPGTYHRVLGTMEGITPYKYPFVDWEYIGAGVKCWQQGIDVYIANPCDVMDRPHVYSPLWLRLGFVPTDRAWTMPIGLGLAVGFFVSLFWVARPGGWRELIVLALTSISPMVFFALERGNVDIVIFVMMVIAGVLATGSLVSRLVSYALMLVAGLFKSYPLVALMTALRERPRTFIMITVVSGFTVAGFAYRFREELAASMRNLPDGGFGAVNLPFDGAKYALQVVPALGQYAWFAALAYLVLSGLLIITLFQVIALARRVDLAAAFARTPERDAIYLVIGSALILGCFFAGVSNGYRGIYLILVAAGLIAMRRVADNPATRRTLAWAIIILMILMWEALPRQFLPKQISTPGVPGLALVTSAVFWLVREILWWRLTALLLGMIVIFAGKSTRTNERSNFVA